MDEGAAGAAGRDGAGADNGRRGPAPVVLARGLAFPEGPLFDAAGALWCVELKGGGLVRLGNSSALPAGSAAGTGLVRVPTGGAPNGLALGTDGRIYFADSGLNAIRVYDPATGVSETVIDSCGRRPLDGPNDLAFDAAGNLVFTCPGNSRVEPTGYVCLVRRGVACVCLVEGLNFPNGLAFGPTADGGAGIDLVVAETYRRRLWRGRWDAESGLWSSARPWAEAGGPIGPDGMAFGADGLLYVAVYGRGRILAFAPDGLVAAEYPMPGANPTNLAFDPSGRLGLVVTEAERGELLNIPGIGPGAVLFSGVL